MDIACIGITYLTIVNAIKKVRTVEGKVTSGIEAVVNLLLCLQSNHGAYRV